MTKEERARLGRRLRTLRIEQRLTQAAVAKRAHVSIATLQALESGKRDTHEANIDKVAQAFGTSLQVLVAVDPPPTTPLTADLNDEDLQIARAYHDATTPLRLRVAALLNGTEIEQS